MPNQPSLPENGSDRAEKGARTRKGNGGDVRAGELDERAAEEVAEADAERRHRKAGDVLVCPERYREEAVE